MYDFGVGSEKRREVGSKFEVLVCELEGEGREDEVEITAVSEVTGTEEGRPEGIFGKDTLSDRLSDCGFSCPGEPVQPVYRRLGEVFSPRLDFVEYSFSCPLETTTTVAMAELCSFCPAAIVQHREVSYQRFELAWVKQS